MKFLNDYTEEATTKAMDEAGAFFAFSNKQFDEQKKDNTQYLDLGAGLICPENTTNKLMASLENIIKYGIEQDIKENGKQAIIRRELDNHEANYTGEIDDTVNALTDYNFSIEDIIKEFKKLN